MDTEIVVTIEGTTPLICNRFTDEAQAKASGGTGGSIIGDKGTPKEQAEQKVYRDEAGDLCIPAPNIFRCIIDGGEYFKVGKSKVTTQKTSMIPACVEIDGIVVPLRSREGWRVDSRPGRNPSTGGRFLLHRPMFDDWALTFTLRVDTSMIAAKTLREIVDAAGKRKGLGDFRPACKGMFGKFVVTKWEVVKLEKELPEAA